MKEMYRILLRPVLSEKADLQRDNASKYTFEVAMDANKLEIRQAVEKIFNVKVDKVNTEVCRGKERRVGRFVGNRPNWKRASVTLKDGYTIDLFGTV
jgi:large subunit ribosomal protein L23